VGHQLAEIDDVLSGAVDRAVDRFILVQLGARYGNYVSKAARFLNERRPGLESTLIAVEASPVGFESLMAKMRNWGLETPPNQFLNLAISDRYESVEFTETGAGSHFIQDKEDPAAENVYVVQTTTIDNILADLTHVDFLEMDIQGAEYKSVRASLESINRKVKLICVRTHWPPREEEELAKMFSSLGWKEVINMENGAEIAIAGEPQKLVDGIQCWANEKLCEGAEAR